MQLPEYDIVTVGRFLNKSMDESAKQSDRPHKKSAGIGMIKTIQAQLIINNQAIVDWFRIKIDTIQMVQREWERI